ncbi:MAG: DUF4398 domain-containing protein [Treponema sp.]|jgi:hypothetical protein|nr:DUF4398 domain-containing protein [Treponema sp.]
MKQKLTVLIIAGLVLGMLAVGCAKPPTEEMNNAIEAVTRAENDNDAVTYAENSIARARDALTRMHNEAASKRYDAAKSYATEAIAAAERAISEGRTNAARARDEASALVSGLMPLVEETGGRLDNAIAARLRIDSAALLRDFSTARNNAGQAQEALNGRYYQSAISLGQTARSDLSEINRKLSEAVETSIQRK